MILEVLLKHPDFRDFALKTMLEVFMKADDSNDSILSNLINDNQEGQVGVDEIEVEVPVKKKFSYVKDKIWLKQYFSRTREHIICTKAVQLVKAHFSDRASAVPEKIFRLKSIIDYS